jgi:hypothetical protein
MSKPDVKKIREMLDSLTTKDWSWSGRTEEPDEDMPGGVFIWHPQGSYLGDTMICLGDTYEDDHKDLDFIAAAPTLLREACERIEALEKVAEVARTLQFFGPNQYGQTEVAGLVNGLNSALSALDAADAEEK